MAYKNYQDQLAASRAWYAKNKKAFIEKKKLRLQSRKEEYWNVLFEKHGKVCSNCGFSRVEALQFHHTEKKDWNVGYMIQNGFGLKRILEEAEKCVVLCANCHFILHAKGE